MQALYQLSYSPAALTIAPLLRRLHAVVGSVGGRLVSIVSVVTPISTSPFVLRPIKRKPRIRLTTPACCEGRFRTRGSVF